MNARLKNAINLLTGRLAMNIYFWVLLIQPKINPRSLSSKDLYAFALWGLIIILAYFNNLVLIPRYLAQKKYRSYFACILASGLGIAVLYWLIVTLALNNYPNVTVNQISIIADGYTGPLNPYQRALRDLIAYYSFLMLIAGIFTMAWYVRNHFRQEKLNEELKRKQLETELLFLKGQINPHFLFNTLNNLYGLSLEQGEQTSNAILKLSSILRYFLYESNAEKVLFDKEKEVMLAYIDLEMLRLRQRHNLNFSINADAGYQIPPLLWLPVLENVFKHGTRFIDPDLMVDFSFSIFNNRLAMYSRNKFKANMAGNKTRDASGIGLANLKQRLEILYPGKHVMETSSDNNFYTIKVDIALK